MHKLGITLSKDQILSIVSEEEIYQYYTSEFPKAKMLSPLFKDRTPSFGFFQSNGRWKWRDFRDVNLTGDVFDFVKIIEHLSSYEETLDFISGRFILNHAERTRKLITGDVIKKSTYVKKVFRLQVVRRDCELIDNLYWGGRYGISPQVRKVFNLIPVRESWRWWEFEDGRKTDKRLAWIHTEDEPLYAYVFPSTNLKVYSPLRNGSRFDSSTVDEMDIFGWHEMMAHKRFHRPLVITKAGKECMFYYRFCINGLALQGESHHFSDSIIKFIREYPGPKLIYLDNDETGYKASLKLHELLEIPYFYNPATPKNITDAYEKDPRAAINLMNDIGLL